MLVRLSKLDVVVVSYGGVGTTFFLKYLAHFFNTNHPDDHDGLKHLAIPPLFLNQDIKFIYLYGNPVQAVLSLFRRHYHCRQSKKLLKQSNSAIAPIPEGTSLEEYAVAGIDRFQFEEHFHNWFSNYLYRPTLFVKYESLFNNVDKIARFLNLDDEFIENFPKQKIRKSSPQKVSSSILLNLDIMYGQFKNELSQIDDICLRIPQNKAFLMNCYIIKAYVYNMLKSKINKSY